MIYDLKPYPAYKYSGAPWLGNVPEHWEVRRIKQVCRLTYGDSLPTEIRQHGIVAVFGSNGRVGFHTISNTHAPCIIIGRKGSFGKVNFSPEPIFAIDTTFFVDERFTKANLRWLFYLLGWLKLDEVSKDSAVPGLDREDAYKRLVAYPNDPAEQYAIARVLDHADWCIHRYVRVKQKLIKLLNEQKQAIIHRAVTRGLDSNVRLKPSGVDWLGDVPEHWDVFRSRRLFYVRKELALPDDVQLSATQAYGVIPQSEFEQKVGRRVVKISMHLEKRRHVEKDDFVISMRSFQGGLERAWASGCIRSSYVVLKPSSNTDVGFFAYLFKSYRYILALQATANFIRDGQDLNFSNFCLVDLPLPSLNEQKAIAEFLDSTTASIDISVKRSHAEIELLREYRTRLIADVVTGKLDVREAAAKLPDITDDAGPLDDTDALIEGEDATDSDLDAIAIIAEGSGE